MEGAGISSGDFVIVRPQNSAEPGQIILASVDGDLTIERYEKMGKRTYLFFRECKVSDY